VSLRGNPIQRTATLPDGREVRIRVGVPDDPYIPKRELDTVDVELFADGEVLAAVNTILGAEQTDEAGDLARAIAAWKDKRSGEFAPLTPTPQHPA
jgi:hypothetical protein